jgi:hypothetical protein
VLVIADNEYYVNYYQTTKRWPEALGRCVPGLREEIV